MDTKPRPFKSVEYVVHYKSMLAQWRSDARTEIYIYIYIRLLIINNRHAAIVYIIQFIPRAQYKYKQYATWGQRRIHSGTVQRRLNGEIELGESFCIKKLDWDRGTSTGCHTIVKHSSVVTKTIGVWFFLVF